MTEEEKKGKNLFEYNGIIYTDNIPKNMFISITKEQYIEYMQQKEKIDKQQEEIEELKETVEFVTSHYISKDKIRNLLRQVNSSLYHFKDSEKNNIVQRVKDKLDQLLEE